MKPDDCSANKLYRGHRQRLRARFLKSGLDGFAEHEIVELLLTFAIPRRDVKPIAKKLLEKFGSLSALLDASEETLRAETGLSDVSISLILLEKSLCARYLETPLYKRNMLSNRADAVKFLQMKLGSRKECVAILYLNQYNYLQCYDFLTGNDNTVLLSPKDIVKKALLSQASGVIVAHNHPGGIPIPSQEDIDTTRQLQQALRLFDITLHDHLIICRDKYISILQDDLI